MALLAVPIGIAVTLLQGWVLSVVWGWFIVPTLGAPRLSLAPAIGLALVVSYLTSSTRPDDRGVMEVIIANAMQAVLVLGLGWIVHLFM